MKRPKAADQTAIADRRKKVAQLALACATQTQIASTLGVSKATICGDLQAIRQEWRAESIEDLEAMVLREAQSLDKMESEVAAQWAASKDPQWQELRLKIKTRRCRLLGLDAEKRVDITSGGAPLKAYVNFNVDLV